MKTRAALALSVTGILLSGGAAFATTQVLTTPDAGTSDDAPSVLVADDSATRSPAPAVSTPKAAAKAVAKATVKSRDDTKADDKKAAVAKKAAKKAAPVVSASMMEFLPLV